MNAHRVGMCAAAGTLLGIVLSGPLAVALVNATHPQPAWQGPDVFVAHYHAVQLVPYLGGIVLVASLVLLISSIHAVAGDRAAVSGAALAFVAAFASLIFFNYVVQTTFVPTLVVGRSPETALMIAAFSMANPRSLAWALEMWGWALLGVATWLVAPVFRGSRLERATATAFVANGPVSIAGAIWTVARPGWVMTPTGLVAFASWNVLLAALAALAFVALRKRARSADAE